MIIENTFYSSKQDGGRGTAEGGKTAPASVEFERFVDGTRDHLQGALQ